MAYRSNRRSRSTPSKRKFIWARAGVQAIVSSGSPFNRNVLESFETRYGAQLIGATVMRVRGIVHWNTGGTAVSGINALLGIRLFTEDPDATTAPGNEEGPAQAPHADWMVYQPSILSADGDPWYAQHRYVIDAKANRKLSELNQGLLLSLEHSASGTALNCSVQLSIGVKLP